MKSLAAILILVSVVALCVAESVLGDKLECGIWMLPFLVITLIGLTWAGRYRASLPEGERERLRRSGFIDGVTSGMAPGQTRLFCLALGVWLSCLGLRIIWHVYG
jgi:hypothetical protein